MSIDCQPETLATRDHHQQQSTLEQQQQQQQQQSNYQPEQVLSDYVAQNYDKVHEQPLQQIHFHQPLEQQHTSSYIGTDFASNQQHRNFNQFSGLSQASFHYQQHQNEQQIAFATEISYPNHSMQQTAAQETSSQTRNEYYSERQHQQPSVISPGESSTATAQLVGAVHTFNSYSHMNHGSEWPGASVQHIRIENYDCQTNETDPSQPSYPSEGPSGYLDFHPPHQRPEQPQHQQIHQLMDNPQLFKSHPPLEAQVTLLQSNDVNNNNNNNSNKGMAWSDCASSSDETNSFQETTSAGSGYQLSSNRSSNLSALDTDTSVSSHYHHDEQRVQTINFGSYSQLEMETIAATRAASVPSSSVSIVSSADDKYCAQSAVKQRQMRCPASLPSSRKTSLIRGPLLDQAGSAFNLSALQQSSSSTATTISHPSTVTASEENSSSSSCTSLTEINYNDLYKFQASNEFSVSGEIPPGHGGSFANLIENLEISTIDSADNSTNDFKKLSLQQNRRGRPRKKGQRLKNKVNGKLWEFIRDLLLDEQSNPSFIKWERREDGVFKFVQSDKVAKMWGERKQNPKMTYEKLSRAMRYYYKSKVLLPVFGRRLVYKFGPNATGWMLKSI